MASAILFLSLEGVGHWSLIMPMTSWKTGNSALKNNPNISFLLVDGKNHNPHYTSDAVKYKDGFFKTYKKMKKKKLLVTKEQKEAFKASYDWHRMTAQDDAVWAEIFKHLDA